MNAHDHGIPDLPLSGPPPSEEAIQTRSLLEEHLARVHELARQLAGSEDALRAKSRILQLVLDSITEGVVVADDKGRFLLFNPAAEGILGKGLFTIPPETWSETYGCFLADGVTPYPSEELPLARAMRGHEVQDAEMFVRNEQRPEGVWLSLTAAPLRNRKGVCRGGVVVFRDATARRREEQAKARRALQLALVADIGVALNEHGPLRRSLQLCAETVVRHLRAAFARIWTLNRRENVLELQASAGMYTHLDGPHGKVKVGEMKIGRIASQRRPLLSNDVTADPAVSDHAWARREGMAAFAGYPLVVEDRLVGVLALFAREPLADDTLPLLGAIGELVAQGIERKRAEDDLAKTAADLERSNEDLQQFAYVASHDLQEPLRMVGGYCKLLQQRYHGQLDAQAEQYLGIAVDGATRMQKLINDLLAYARVNTQGRRPSPTDAQAVFSRVLQSLQDRSGESAAVVTADGLPTVRADESQLTQLFQNLLSNALKFHGGGPARVHVTARRHDGDWVFSFRDEGIGLPAEDAERVFGLFERLHPVSKYPGAGLGLAICKRIVERHGGRIWVESAPGKGADFRFTLPA